MIIAPPKSASTFVYQVLRHLLNAEGSLSFGHFDPAPASGIRQASRWFVVREHVLPNTAVLSLLDQPFTHAIILTRDLADSVVSLSEEWQRQWSDGYNRIQSIGFSQQFLGPLPTTFVEKFMMASDEVRHDMIIDVAVPWYCQFIAGWCELRSRHQSSWLTLDYDEMVRDQVSAIDTLLGKLGAPLARRHIERGVSKLSKSPFINFNKGYRGRGHELLTLSQQQRIKRIWRAFASSAHDDAIVQNREAECNG